MPAVPVSKKGRFGALFLLQPALIAGIVYRWTHQAAAQAA